MNRFSLTVSTAAVLVALSFPAAASTVTWQDLNDPFVDNGHANVRIVYDNPNGKDVNEPVSAGGFALSSADLGGNFIGWCVDILDYLKKSSDYDVTAIPPVGSLIAGAADNIQALFNTAYAGLNRSLDDQYVTDDAQSAGFQLALWEILYETKGSFDLEHGDFTASSSNADVIIAAEGFLEGLTLPRTRNYKNYNLTYLLSTEGSQHLVTASAVPLPAAGLLLLGAIGGLGVTRRRRKAAVGA